MVRQYMSDTVTPTAGAKTVAFLVEKVGFPVVAFLLMFLLCGFVVWKVNATIEANTRAIEANTRALQEFSSKQVDFQRLVLDGHAKMSVELEILLQKVGIKN